MAARLMHCGAGSRCILSTHTSSSTMLLNLDHTARPTTPPFLKEAVSSLALSSRETAIRTTSLVMATQMVSSLPGSYMLFHLM